MQNIFVDGMRFERPSEKAPDFIKGHISVNVEKFSTFAQHNNKKGWMNIDLKMSKEGNLYLALNTYQKEQGSPSEAEELNATFNQ